MANLLKRLPIYVAALSTMVLPFAPQYSRAQEAKSDLVTIAEREVNGKKLEYKSSPDIQVHMGFLAGLANGMIGYENIKGLFLNNLVEGMDDVKKEIADGCKQVDNDRVDRVVTEKEIMRMLPHIGRCEVGRKIGTELVDLVSIEDEEDEDKLTTYRGTRAVEEHLWAAYVTKLQSNDEKEVREIRKVPVIGFDAQMWKFSAKADKDGDGIVSADEYITFRKDFFKKTTLRDFSSAIGASGKVNSPMWKEVVTRNWDLWFDTMYLTKFIKEIYASPTSFGEANFTKEEREEIRSLSLEKMDKKNRKGFKAVLPWIDIKKPTLADKTFTYTFMKMSGMDSDAIKDTLDSTKSFFNRDEPLVEKRVISESPTVPRK